MREVAGRIEKIVATVLRLKCLPERRDRPLARISRQKVASQFLQPLQCMKTPDGSCAASGNVIYIFAQDRSLENAASGKAYAAYRGASIPGI
jgi:hypothetical protein